MKKFYSLCGRLYDLALNFDIVRKVDAWDFTPVSDLGFRILKPGEKIGLFYLDAPLLVAYAFAILWEKDCLAVPGADHGAEAKAREEAAFCQALRTGEDFQQLRDALWEAIIAFHPFGAGDFHTMQQILDEKARQYVTQNDELKKIAVYGQDSDSSTPEASAATTGNLSGESAGTSATDGMKSAA